MKKNLHFLACLIGIFFISVAATPVLTAREEEMIKEINYARARPAEYTQYIQEYLDYWDASTNMIKEAEKLRQLMLKMKPLDTLHFSPVLYSNCIKHGEWMKKTGEFEHSNFKLYYGENLCAGNESVRMAVVDLLIDYGVPGYGHRVNIFHPQFYYIAVHEVPGEVREDEYVFIQQFGFREQEE